METLANEKERIQRMNSLFKKLNADEQKELIRLLQKSVDLEEASRLNNLVQPNAMSLDEIVKEARASRSKVYARTNDNT